jgi:hypothetical protein
LRGVIRNPFAFYFPIQRRFSGRYRVYRRQRRCLRGDRCVHMRIRGGPLCIFLLETTFVFLNAFKGSCEIPTKFSLSQFDFTLCTILAIGFSLTGASHSSVRVCRIVILFFSIIFELGKALFTKVLETSVTYHSIMIIRTPRTFFTRFGKVIFRGGGGILHKCIFSQHIPSNFHKFRIQNRLLHIHNVHI